MEQLMHGLNIPTKIYYGRDILEKGIKRAHSESGIVCGNVLVVTTGRSLIRLGYLNRLKEALQNIDDVKNVIVYDQVSANPKLTEISDAISIGKKEKCDMVVGFGGGSALDAAKAVAAGIPAETDIKEMFRGNQEPQIVLPIIAVPTTAGTGSELSKAAILSDTELGTKGGLRGSGLFPRAAIVDSVFTESVPFATTMETGFDVLAHAIESYVAKTASPFSEMLSEYVIREAAKSIRRLTKDLNDTQAREKMSFCSMIMGINLGNTGTALPHRMQYPIGAHTESSHGAGLAALYPSWMKYEKLYSSEKISKVLVLMECKEIEELLTEMKLTGKLRDFGIQENELLHMADEVTGNVGNDPASVEKDIIYKIYQESF